ncbi:glycoside hydrolase superfamily [Lophiotrema nucula]|uniref:chitinase n=1 Tax=Lophiotrema nucula TaxID=690887 RepID=A0A6A5YPP1_9PLEO|nr:glycoside hydrolase superfamily [Lophiotrema nucula]
MAAALFAIVAFISLLPVMAKSSRPTYAMYLTGQHNVVPDSSLVTSITHVVLAFMQSATFNQPDPSSWPLFTTVEDTRSRFAKGTVVMVAIGGWGDTAGFSEAAKSDGSRRLFAKNVKAMIDHTGADGVDIDWEYPGGNGEDYLRVPNDEKAWEIDAYPKLLAEIRTAIGSSKLISAAIPGLPRDMIAFTAETVPVIDQYVDHFNIMTYDLMNRRDNITKHHAGIVLSLEAINTYLSRGIPASKANLGFAFYVKWFKTDPDAHANCSAKPVGCATVLMEDPKTGEDLGQAGAFSWHDEVPSRLAQSFRKALSEGSYDTESGGYYYWDGEENTWWTFETPESILLKCSAVVQTKGLGGVFAWGLGEDANGFEHLQALCTGFENAFPKRSSQPESERVDEL